MVGSRLSQTLPSTVIFNGTALDTFILDGLKIAGLQISFKSQIRLSSLTI